MFSFFGCVAKSPPLTNPKDRIFTAPSVYSSKLQEAPSTHDWVKEISSDKILSGLIKGLLITISISKKLQTMFRELLPLPE